MATEGQMVSAVGNTLDNEYQSLVDLMNDMADGEITGNDGTIHANEDGSTTMYGSWKGYEIGGVEFETSHRTSNNSPFAANDAINASSPSTMLRLSTGTTTQQIFTGQLTDGAMKISAMKKAVAQKVG